MSGVRASPPVLKKNFTKIIVKYIKRKVVKNINMGIANYIKESYRELTQEVTWISLEEGQKQTVLVIVFTIIFSLAVFITDKFFQTLLDNIFRIFS